MNDSRHTTNTSGGGHNSQTGLSIEKRERDRTMTRSQTRERGDLEKETGSIRTVQFGVTGNGQTKRYANILYKAHSSRLSTILNEHGELRTYGRHCLRPDHRLNQSSLLSLSLTHTFSQLSPCRSIKETQSQRVDQLKVYSMLSLSLSLYFSTILQEYNWIVCNLVPSIISMKHFEQKINKQTYEKERRRLRWR